MNFKINRVVKSSRLNMLIYYLEYINFIYGYNDKAQGKNIDFFFLRLKIQGEYS